MLSKIRLFLKPFDFRHCSGPRFYALRKPFFSRSGRGRPHGRGAGAAGAPGGSTNRAERCTKKHLEDREILGASGTLSIHVNINASNVDS